MVMIFVDYYARKYIANICSFNFLILLV